MIILMEGLDKVGKDSNLEMLKKEFPEATISNLEQDPKDNSDKYRTWVKDGYAALLKDAIERLPKMTIFNRCWASEQIYSIKRGKSLLWDINLMNLSRKLRKHKHILFYLYNNNEEEMKERMIREKEDNLKFEERKMISNRYDQFIGQSMLNVHRIDTSRPKEEVFEEILKKVKEHGI